MKPARPFVNCMHALQLDTRNEDPNDILSVHFRKPTSVQLKHILPACDQTDMYSGGAFEPDGRCIFLIPFNASQCGWYDTTSNTLEPFGPSFPFGGGKWSGAAVSSVDGCIYSVPQRLLQVWRMLKIDPVRRSCEMVGGDVRRLAPDVESTAWEGTVAGANGCIYGLPSKARSVLCYDPRTQEISVFGELEDAGSLKV